MLDFSRRPELALHASVVADVEAAAAPLGVASLVAGAFARDLHLLHAHNIPTQRQTEDLDIAMAVPDWAAYEAVRARLIASGSFRALGNAAHRLRHRSDLPVDLVPFGSVETRERTIVWPPRGEVVMDVFGFKEAFGTAHTVLFPGNVKTKLVSLPALALLKLVCWQDRHYSSPGKDAHDLWLILRSYLHAGNEQRLWDEFAEWTQDNEFEYERAGARMLGHDVRLLLDADGIDRIRAILSIQADSDNPARLPGQMDSNDPERARNLLEAMLGGLLKN